jgi:hypothetical protein
VKSTNTASDLKRQIESERGVHFAKQEILHANGQQLADEFSALSDLGIQEGSLLLLRIKESFADLNAEQIERMKGFTLLLIQGIEVSTAPVYFERS